VHTPSSQRVEARSKRATRRRSLTVKLRGRTTTLHKRRGPTISHGSRGAKPTTPHGPLERLLAGSPLAFPPQARIARRMQHRDHDDVLLREDIEHAEGKSLYKRSAEFAAHETKGHRIGFNAPERRVDFREEPGTEAVLRTTASRPLNRPLPPRGQSASASPRALKPCPDLLPRRSLRRILFKSGEPAIKLLRLCRGKFKLFRDFSDAVPDRLHQTKPLRHRQADHVSYGDVFHGGM